MALHNKNNIPYSSVAALYTHIMAGCFCEICYNLGYRKPNCVACERLYNSFDILWSYFVICEHVLIYEILFMNLIA